MTLQRLVLTFTREGIEMGTLYRTKHGPNPGTKARTRATLEALIARHEGQAAKLMDVQPKGA